MFVDILRSKQRVVFFHVVNSMVCFLLLAGSDSWTKQTLLLHHHQLQEKRAGAKGLTIHFMMYNTFIIHMFECFVLEHEIHGPSVLFRCC